MDKNEFFKQISPKPYLEYREYDFSERYELMLGIANTICPGFELTDYNKNLYESGIRYFAGDPKSEFPLTKGLMLYGPVGTGKSLFFRIMNLLNDATKGQNGFTTLSINEVVDGLAKSGHKYLAECGITFSNHVYGYDSSKKHLFLDDLCLSSDSVNFFGNNIDLVFNFIQRRYQAYTENNILSHITTNLKPDRFSELYGEAVMSRMNQLFFYKALLGKDHRK
jgi:DNA replication protein DnaC